MNELRLVVNIPLAPPRELNPNRGASWWVRHRVSRPAKQAAYLAARSAMYEPGAPELHLLLPEAWEFGMAWTVYLPKGWQVCDDDNMLPCCKPMQDGICEAILINDRLIRHPTVDQERDPDGRGRTVAVVTARLREDA